MMKRRHVPQKQCQCCEEEVPRRPKRTRLPSLPKAGNAIGNSVKVVVSNNDNTSKNITRGLFDLFSYR